MTVYSLDVLLSQFGTSLLFHVQLLLLDLHTDFSEGRSGGLVFLSLEEFSTVYCDPHSQRLYHSQWSRCFCEFSCFLYESMNVGNLMSDFSTFSKSSLYIWKFSVLILFKPSLKDFENYLAIMWNKRNCAVVWTFFDIALLWDWNENWHFPVLWPLLSFPNLLTHWGQHFNGLTF